MWAWEQAGISLFLHALTVSNSTKKYLKQCLSLGAMKYHLSNFFFLSGLAAGIRKLCWVRAHGTRLLGSSSCSQQGRGDLSAAPGTCTSL